jgi:sortase A
MKTLLWIERALLAAGLTMAAWAGLVVTQARFIEAMPPPKVSVPTATAVARGSWVARLEAPSARLTATVLEGSDDDTLRKGAGHIEGTAFPGDDGNVGIAGHRDTTFRRVRHLEVGDILTLQTRRARFDYRIMKTMIVEPDAVEVLDPTAHPTLTLVTCYPFSYIGPAPKRYILQAHLIRETVEPAERR